MKNRNANFKIQPRKSSLMLVAMVLLISIAPIFGAVETSRNGSPSRSIFNSSNGFSNNLFDTSANRSLAFSLFSPQAVLVVNTTGDQNDQLPGDGFCNDGAGNCSLRAAIQEANAAAGAQVINFDIPGSCGQTISPTSQLPDITDSVTIDGYSQQGALPNTSTTGDNAVICVMLNGTNATTPSFASGLTVNAANTTIRGLAIGNFTDTAVNVNANGGIVEGNFIGTRQSFSTAAPNRYGIYVYASNVRVGGTTLASRNLVFNNTTDGIGLGQAGGSNTVQNNYVAVNAHSGINIFRSGNNLIGGATATARNVIFGNGTNTAGGFDGSGVYIYGDTQFSQSPNNTIQGNYIGTDVTGTVALGNKINGVQISGAINTTVTGNVVSGNIIDGIGISGSGATGNVVKGNIVGQDYLTSVAIGNGRDGISIYQVGGNTVGGTGGGDGNTVGGNGQYGVQINGNGATAENNVVQGNFIGFGLNGIAKPQSGGIAVLVANNNTIGGTTAAARNIVAGNTNVGIIVISASGNTISGNYVGILGTTSTLSNNRGIQLQNATNNTVGGTATGAGNVVSGNQIGVRLVATSGQSTSGNQITGNLIGTTPDGLTARGNEYGIATLNAFGNTIGGTTAAARNIISGNTLFGVNIQSSGGNQVIGNYIGTKPDGMTALPNEVGLSLYENVTNGNQIGGTATGAGNVISGNNGDGVSIFNAAALNAVQGNIIGLKADGSAALPNANGIQITEGANQNFIGDSTANAGNIISGNRQNGILITGGARINYVRGNKIGTDPAGTIARPNAAAGITISQGSGNNNTTNNSIGDATVAGRNIISGNTNSGIVITGANTTGTTVAGNYIGTTVDGTAALGNIGAGVDVQSSNTTIGGATSDSRNVISGQNFGISVISSATNVLIKNNYVGTNAAGDASLSGGNGTNIQCAATSFCTIDSNLVSGGFLGIYFANVNAGRAINNRIGTNAAGTALLGNSTGIYINNSSNLKIGEDVNGAAAPNIIAGSGGSFGGSGIVVVGTSANNLFRQNSIYDNANLGLDLGNDGVTQNDNQDADGGANNFQNFPVINNATTTISGSLNSTPNRSFRIEFFSSLTADPTGYGEGRTFLTNQTVTTDGSGNAVFSVSNPQPLGSYISATATDLVTSDTSEFSGYKQTLTPTAVRFAGARAKAFDNGALIEWQTGLESDNLGFNIYRERGGKRELVNRNIIAGSALMTDAQLLSGQNYSWFDPNGDEQTAYYIEAIDLNGAKDVYGSFSAEKVSGAAPARFNSTTLESLGETNAETKEAAPKAAAFKPTTAQTDVQNILANSASVKLSVKQAGFYRVTAEQLFAGGLPTNTNFANLRMFAEGIEQPINILNENGAFAGVEFYGIGADTSETATRIYYLAASDNAGLRLTKFDETRPASSANSFLSTVERRDRTIYFSGLLNGDAENFFGAVVGSAGANQTLNLSSVAATSETAKLEIKLQGVTRTAHNVRVELNGSFAAAVAFSEMEQGSATVSVPPGSLREGENMIRLTADNAGDVSLVDSIRLTYPRRLNAAGNALTLTADGERETTVRGFTTRNVRIFDVTDANAPFELAARIRADVKDGSIEQTAKIANTQPQTEKQSDDSDADRTSIGRSYSATFAAVGSGKRSLIAVSNPLAPVNIEANRASNLRDRRNAANLIIITRHDLVASLEPLAALRRSQGLNVRIVDIADIYDEFSFGRKSSQSIHDFLQFAATTWLKKPQFVILAGDGTYDPKGYVFGDGADVVQTKLVDAENMETASDEWLTDFDGDGVGDLAVGRLPANNAAEMNAIVGKLLNYDAQTLVNSAAFVADASDGFDFAAGNATVRALYPQAMNFVEINREADDTTTARTALLNAINGGQRIVNYTGHGSSTIWRGNLLTTTDANNLQNGDRLPVFVTMSCLNGYFTNADTESLSEALLKNPNGGAIAVWASTGTTQPDSQTELNRAFARALFDGNQQTIGQAVQTAKRSVSNVTIRRTWTLFGDPTMRLR